jgi:cytochrome b561
MQISRYTRPAIALHWLIALFIIANVLLAWAWPFLADETVRPVINWHKTIGFLVLGLAIMRLPGASATGRRPCRRGSRNGKWACPRSPMCSSM